jgi:general secretion pathway protein J
MIARRDDLWRAEAGFTLIEALASLALMGVILSFLSLITAQWLPAWSRTFDRVQRSEALMTAMDRMAADITAAEIVRIERRSKAVLFDGGDRTLTLVRNAIGPNAVPGLEIVRIGETTDRQGPAVVRSRAAFSPGTRGVDPAAGAVVMLRAPYRVTFAYAAPDKIWKQAWRGSDKMPAAVLLTIEDAGRRMPPISRIVPVRAEISAEALCSQQSGCSGEDGKSPETQSVDPAHPDGKPPSLEDVSKGLR